jgi:hypothetical protein
MTKTRDDLPAEQPNGVSLQQAMWSWAIAIVLVLGLGAVFYGINARHSTQTAAQQPAIMAAPAPAARVPAPPAETNTGQPLPAPETMGQGGARR